MLDDNGIPDDERVLAMRLTDKEASRVLDIPPDLLKVFRSTQLGPRFLTDESGEPAYEFSEVCIWLFYKLFEPADYVDAIENAFARKGPVKSLSSS